MLTNTETHTFPSVCVCVCPSMRVHMQFQVVVHDLFLTCDLYKMKRCRPPTCVFSADREVTEFNLSFIRLESDS